VCEIYVILTTHSSPFTLGNCRQIFCQIDFKKKMSVQHSVVPVFCPFPVNQMYVIVEAAQFFSCQCIVFTFLQVKGNRSNSTHRLEKLQRSADYLSSKIMAQLIQNLSARVWTVKHSPTNKRCTTETSIFSRGNM